MHVVMCIIIIIIIIVASTSSLPPPPSFAILDQVKLVMDITRQNTTGLSKKMDGIWNRYNLKCTGRIYMFAS